MIKKTDKLKSFIQFFTNIYNLEKRLTALETKSFERDPFLCEHCHKDLYCHVGEEDNPNAMGVYVEKYVCRGCGHVATPSWKERVLRHH